MCDSSPALANNDWIREYVGIPFQACGRDAGALDCWGLVCRVYRDRFGVELPVYAEAYSALLARVCGSTEAPGAEGWKELPKPAHLCVVAMSFRASRAMHHVGVFLDVDGGKILHALAPASALHTKAMLRDMGYHTFRFYERL